MEKKTLDNSHHISGGRGNTIKPIVSLIQFLAKVYDKFIKQPFLKKGLGACGHHVVFRWNEWHQPWKYVFLSDHTQLVDATIISHGGKLIIKHGSGAAEGLTVITNMHDRKVGSWFYETATASGLDFEKDIVVEEDVWIGANVTLLGGCNVGRGSHVGAGSVVRNAVPPYSVVIGNPAKVVGFCMTPEEVVEHERVLYKEEDRLPLTLLQKNYEKYFLNKTKDIRHYCSINC